MAKIIESFAHYESTEAVHYHPPQTTNHPLHPETYYTQHTMLDRPKGIESSIED